PEVLILDEPTVGLDPHQIIEIRNLIRELAAEHTVLLSSHILPEVAATCDRVIILNEGAVVAIDTQEQLKLRVSGGERLAVELAGAAAAEAAEAYSGLPGVAAVKPVNTGDPGAVRLVIECSKNSDPRADIFKKTVERGWTMLELSRDSLSLEDVFLKLTRESGAND
ncbi:MAG TPA: ABC transporter, partial [bacterium]|nr:ABC transporter [bacterium]